MGTSNPHHAGLGRRAFIGASAAAIGALAGPLSGLAQARPRGPRQDNGYGPLVPAVDATTGLALLKLPRGFRYQSFGWTGDVMDDGTLTPDRHHGMAVVSVRKPGPVSLGALAVGKRELVLIRNHERGPSEPGNPLPVIGAGDAPVYDDFQAPGVVAGLGGGTTAVTFSKGRFTGSQATLGGTLTNCAGGPARAPERLPRQDERQPPRLGQPGPVRGRRSG